MEIEAKDTEEDRSAEKNVAKRVDDSEAPSLDEKHEKKKRGTRLEPLANNDRALAKVISSTPADELAARPSGRRKCEVASKKGESRSCSRIPPDGAISSRNETSKAPSIIRRPSDRLRDKIANSSTSNVIEDVETGEAETLTTEQTSGKDIHSSTSSAASPGAYAVPGPGIHEPREGGMVQESQVEEGNVLAEEGGDSPIDAFVVGDPISAIAFGEEVDKEENKGIDRERQKRNAIFAVFGMLLVISVVGLVFGVLVSKPKHGKVENTSTTDADIVRKTQIFSTPPSFLEDTAETVSGNIDVDGQNFDVDGDTLLVAAKSKRNDMSKIAYVYNKVKGKWTLGATITYGRFKEPGYPVIDVAICGEYIFVGQSGDDAHGIRSGSVLVYKRNEENQWTHNTILYASDGNAEDMFGSSLSCDGNNLVVGAVHRHDRKVMQSTHEDNADAGDRTHDGSAYIFSLIEGTGWSQVAHLNPVNGNFQQQFGCSVAISNDVAAVGSDKHNYGIDVGGSVHIYVKQDSVWALADVLLPNDLREGDHFGISVDVDEKGNIVAGAKHRSIEAVYIFRREGETQWVEEARLEASDGNLERSFGHSVALHSSANLDFAVVGAFKDSEIRSGAAYVYRKIEDNRWNETRKLVPKDLIDDINSFFGSSVGIRESNDVAEVIVGAGAMGRVYSVELC